MGYEDTYAALDETDCLAITQCGNQLAVGENDPVTRLIGESNLVAGTCTLCANYTYAIDDLTDCAAITQCGNQADGLTPRLNGPTRFVAGTCDLCINGSWSFDNTVDC